MSTPACPDGLLLPALEGQATDDATTAREKLIEWEGTGQTTTGPLGALKGQTRY
jgi:hypothetical protein